MKDSTITAILSTSMVFFGLALLLAFGSNATGNDFQSTGYMGSPYIDLVVMASKSAFFIGLLGCAWLIYLYFTTSPKPEDPVEPYVWTNKLHCPKCGYPQYCGCEACKARLPENIKPYKYLKDGSTIRCGNCGFEESEDWWLMLSGAVFLENNNIPQTSEKKSK